MGRPPTSSHVYRNQLIIEPVESRPVARMRSGGWLTIRTAFEAEPDLTGATRSRRGSLNDRRPRNSAALARSFLWHHPITGLYDLWMPMPRRKYTWEKLSD